MVEAQFRFRDDEPVAERPGLRQVAGVADVHQIEAAVREDDAPAIGLPARAQPCGCVEVGGDVRRGRCVVRPAGREGRGVHARAIVEGGRPRLKPRRSGGAPTQRGSRPRGGPHCRVAGR